MNNDLRGSFREALRRSPLYWREPSAPLSTEITIEPDDILVGGIIGLLSVSPKLGDGVQASHTSSVHAPAVSGHQPLPFAVCLGLPSLPLPDIADFLF